MTGLQDTIAWYDSHADELSKHERFFQWFAPEEFRALLQEAGFDILLHQDSLPSRSGRKGVQWIRSLVQKPAG